MHVYILNIFIPDTLHTMHPLPLLFFQDVPQCGSRAKQGENPSWRMLLGTVIPALEGHTWPSENVSWTNKAKQKQEDRGQGSRCQGKGDSGDLIYF